MIRDRDEMQASQRAFLRQTATVRYELPGLWRNFLRERVLLVPLGSGASRCMFGQGSHTNE